MLEVAERRQELIEKTFYRKFIDQRIEQEYLANPEIVKLIELGVSYLNAWLSQSYYDTKDARLAHIKKLDLFNLVKEAFVNVAYCQTPELFTSVSAKLAGRLKFSDHADSIKTMAEILAVLCHTDAFDIIKEDKYASLYLRTNLPVSKETLKFIMNTRYLPPMISLPKKLTRNYQSAYYTFDSSLILGKARNFHNGDLCLDVLNSKNSVPLSLNLEFLKTVEEEPKNEPKTVEEEKQWNKFKKESYEVYTLLAKQGNEFYLTHKRDERGRVYAQGYHVTTQGASFKKASIELANKEALEGVPTQFIVEAGKYEQCPEEGLIENCKYSSELMSYDEAVEDLKKYQSYPYSRIRPVKP